MKKLLASIGSLSIFRRKNKFVEEGFAPYIDPTCNRLYNLMFCDKLKLMRQASGDQPQGAWGLLLAEQPYAAGLKTIAEDETQTTRARIVAYNRLREINWPVPERLLLGVVVEIAQEDGLDVLATYTDRSVQFLDHSEAASTFESAPTGWRTKTKDLFAAAQTVIERIGPWELPRIAPPTAGMIRMSFLVSDGLYFGQGPLEMMKADEMAGPIIAANEALLKDVVAASVRSGT